jgi:hypothetical protein
MSSMIFRRRDFDPDEEEEIAYEAVPAGAPFCKTGQRRLYFTSKGLEFRQPVDDTNAEGAPTVGTPTAPIRIVDMGLGNTASGDRSVVVGGENNHADANRSVVLGGSGVTADVPNAAFAQSLHTTEYLRLAVYATVAAIPNDAEFEGALVYVQSPAGLHIWDGSVWQPV